MFVGCHRDNSVRFHGLRGEDHFSHGTDDLGDLWLVRQKQKLKPESDGQLDDTASNREVQGKG